MDGQAHYEIRVGDTDPVVFTLYEVDPDTHQTTVVNLAGVTQVDFRLRSIDGSETMSFLDSGSQLAITDAANGKVTFYPSGTDFTYARRFYNGFFRVTDAGGYKKSFPHDGSIQLEVVESY